MMHNQVIIGVVDNVSVIVQWGVIIYGPEVAGRGTKAQQAAQQPRTTYMLLVTTQSLI